MSPETTPSEDRSETGTGPIIRVLLAIRGSFVYSVMAFGVILTVLGVINDLTGIIRPLMSAMLVVWGISAIVYGLAGIVGLRLIGYS